MAYIGKKVEETDLTNRTVDTMVGDGSDTTLTLSATPISVNNVLVFINGIMQRPTTDYTISGTTLTFGTAPFTGGIVVAITGGGEHIGVPLAKIATDKISDGAVTSAKINSLSASKITGALPALDGSALTGISAVSNITTSASDPTISSNPSSGLGTVWANTTSGETYILTDATASANVWTNVGSGDGDVEPFVFQGTTFGYHVGGSKGNPSPTQSNVIGKFSFASDTNATDAADLTTTLYGAATSRSTTHGFAAGGGTVNGGSPINTIQKFPFATDTNATNVGTLSITKWYPSGQSSGTNGYACSGHNGTTFLNIIDKYSTVSDGNSSDIGDMTNINYTAAGQSSQTHGYAAGGENSGGSLNVIERITFATDSNATDWGDLTSSRWAVAGCSSSTHGYSSGGNGPLDRIDKFAFASSGNATDVGNLVAGQFGRAGSSSTSNGYVMGGSNLTNSIEKFSFSSDGNAADAADMTHDSGKYISAIHT